MVFQKVRFCSCPSVSLLSSLFSRMSPPAGDILAYAFMVTPRGLAGCCWALELVSMRRDLAFGGPEDPLAKWFAPSRATSFDAACERSGCDRLENMSL